ncbi:hypothetical protein [Halorussus sp. MSC15.2]|uniref:hypothetical protein n=1 Tax=Halorussus sp. MSC15.2 TaxID=2283638 RepID=UPI0013D306F1|nr:hypothetical protein [Halorussus sp. MSC15.2]NEU57574.1 hypothetical protein [Halorussus sp. MSC15.2]
MSDTLHFGLFFLGIFLLTGALVVGVGALEYEVQSQGTTAAIPEDAESVVSYDDLSERDRQTVDRVLDGERSWSGTRATCRVRVRRGGN